MKKIYGLLGALGIALALPSQAEVISRDYDGYSIFIDCDLRSAIYYEYTATKDTGNHKRHSKFYFAPDVPKRCQQTSTGSYKGSGYDRGHQFPANHADYSAKAIKESNYMINVLPQKAQLNRGAMLATEEITECYRDIEPVKVMGGIFPKERAQNTRFLKTHGIVTPAHFWKVLLREDRALAYIFPNTKDATEKNLDKYLTTIDEIEKRAGITISAPDYLKSQKASHSWQIPMGCNKS